MQRTATTYTQTLTLCYINQKPLIDHIICTGIYVWPINNATSGFKQGGAIFVFLYFCILIS